MIADTIRKVEVSIKLSITHSSYSQVAVASDDQLRVAPPRHLSASTPTLQRESYGQILKSSALIGGSQVANIAIGIVRTKAMAMLLGPAGFGLFGLYGSIANLTQSLAGMGINSSGVRQIAEAVGSGDKTQIARTAAVLRRTSIVLGLLGAAFLVLFSKQVSRLTFGSADRAAAVSLLSIAVFCTLASGGQGALIQGMRRIPDLAKMNVLGALFGVCIAIPLVYFFGEKGVVPSLVGVAGMTILTSWWYSRKIHICSATVTLSQIREEAATLLKLGSVFMASGFMTMGVAYTVRIMILHKLGFEATGQYQAAWAIGGLYVGFILQAMGADFYPRLTASISNCSECNRLVNDQTLVGLLIAAPGVLATLTLAPLVIRLLYSANFMPAVVVLRWICLGAMLQVITWPMGFIVVAKGRQNLFFLSELAWTVFAVLVAWLCLQRYGLEGAGIAFFGSYVFHGFLAYSIARSLTGFRLSTETKRQGLVFLLLIGLVFAGFRVMPLSWAEGLGVLVALASCLYVSRVLLRLVHADQLPAPIRRWLLALRLLAPIFGDTSAAHDMADIG
jgi:antigen flippase